MLLVLTWPIVRTMRRTTRLTRTTSLWTSRLVSGVLLARIQALPSTTVVALSAWAAQATEKYTPALLDPDQAVPAPVSAVALVAMAAAS